MNDDAFPEVSADDVLLSAHLDGEAAPEEAARVEADAELRARRAELGEVRRWVASPVEVPPQARDDAIAAALRIFDDEVEPGRSASSGASPRATAAAGPGSGAASVTSMGDAAARRNDRRNSRRVGTPAWLAVAAGALLVLFGVGAYLRASTVQNDVATSAASPPEASLDVTTDSNKTQTEAPTEHVTSGAPGGEQAPGSTFDAAKSPSESTPPTTVATIPPRSTTVPSAGPSTNNGASTVAYAGYLGRVGSPEQLRDAVAGALTARDASGTGGPTTIVPAPSAYVDAVTDIQSCAATVAAGDHEIGPLVISGAVEYAGTNAVVLVYTIDLEAHPAANGPVRMYTTEIGSCRVLDVQTI